MSAEWSSSAAKAFDIAASMRRIIAMLEGEPGAADALLAPDILFLFETIGSGRGQSESHCASDMILSSLSEPERRALLSVYRSVATSATDIAASPFGGDA